MPSRRRVPLSDCLRLLRRPHSWRLSGRRAARAEQLGQDLGRAVMSVEAELACALTLTQRGAEGLVDRAARLARLPGTAAALAAGVIDDYRARVIADQLAVLDVAAARRVEDKLLATAAGLTSGQLRAAAFRAAFAVDPAAARRRREQAQRQARVERWREPSGTASLAGRDLPPAGALAADKRIDALARQLKNSGAAASLDQLRASVYVALLTGTPIDELATPAPDPAAEPAGSAAEPGDRTEPGAGAEPGSAAEPGGAEPGGGDLAAEPGAGPAAGPREAAAPGQQTSPAQAASPERARQPGAGSSPGARS